MRAPSVKKLTEAFRDLTPEDAKLIRKFAKVVDDRDELEELVDAKAPATAAYVRQMYHSPYDSGMWRTTVALHAIDQLMGGYGIEPLGPISMREGPPYEFVNFGDPYDTTLIYDRDKDRLFIGAWGDLPEIVNRDWADDEFEENPSNQVIPLPSGDPGAIFKVPVGDYVIQPTAEDSYAVGLRTAPPQPEFIILGYVDWESEADALVRKVFQKRHDKYAKVWWEKGHGSERRLVVIDTLRQSNPGKRKNNPHPGLPTATDLVRKLKF